MSEQPAQPARTIWGRANSVNVQKVLWCCHELGLEFTRIDAGWHFGRNREPEYLAMNPNGRVPTLVEDNFILWESNTICRYLAQKYGPDSRLYPGDLRQRAMVDKWLDWSISSYGPVERDLYWGLIRTARDERDMPALNKIADRLGVLWEIVDANLSGRRFMAGEEFSLADICLGAYARRWFGFVDLEKPSFVKLASWHDRISRRPGYRLHLAHPLT
ncbi:glutathione S-transferase [Starkeya sp. ORNL1]|uniref:glutathione S-transferase family protein n=1 Tax=Starkeya sp. ORNL1 TaxID=2709380 RepID=UPI0014644B7E|nr:glutathione S-transferase N-terminal domain-containing protein [Starkeya sp. ORNL1]QJP14413.1 glutathione S-transferase [Starkeya sp. ORNL1]